MYDVTKKIIACLSVLSTVIVSLPVTTSANANIAKAQQIISTIDSQSNEYKEVQELKHTIEGFFRSYEIAYDDYDVSNNSYKDFWVVNNNSRTNLNLAVIDMFLYHRIATLTNHVSGKIIQELNKEMTFRYSMINISDNTAMVDVCISKTFNYSICPDVDSATLDSYTVTLVRENEKWKINAISNFIPEDILFSMEEQGLNVDDLSSIKKYKENIVSEICKNNINLFSENKDKYLNSNAKSTTYDASGAVNYANTYVFSPNSNYFNNESGGGDCTNFASQVMHEGGGIPMHYGASGYNTSWFYTNSYTRSTSWAGAQELYDYMHSSYSQISYTSSSWSSISKGDLIQVGATTNIGHSMIVTGIVYSSSGRADLLVTYRSVTNYHRKNILLSSRGSETRQYIHINGGV